MLLSHRRNRHVLLTCILAAAASTILALALTARADASDIGWIYPNPAVKAVFPRPEPCASRPPDATATLPYPGQFTVSSPDASYSDPCGYVVDASVAATPTGFAFVGAAPPDNYKTQSACNQLRMSVTIYNLSAGKFTTLAWGRFRGNWTAKYGKYGCELLQVAGFWPLGGNGGESVLYFAAPMWPTTWRVAASANAETSSGSFPLPVAILGVSEHF